MTAERCPRCDRPRCDDGSPVAMQDDAFCYFVGWSGCDRFAVDWRAKFKEMEARALAAEAQVCRLKTGEWIESDVLCQHDMQHLAAINARDEWEKRALAAEAARDEADAIADKEMWCNLLHYDIARRALVEGLAEADRLRFERDAANDFAADVRSDYEKLRAVNGDIIAGLAVCVGPDDDLPTVVRDRMKAIRAEAAREERAAVVKAIADHFATLADNLNHRRVVHGNSMVCARRESAFYEAAGIVRATDWAAIANGDHAKGGE